MENNEEMDNQELSEMIEYLIEIGAMEIMGMILYLINLHTR